MEHLKRTTDVESYGQALHFLTLNYFLKTVELPRQVAQHPYADDDQIAKATVKTMNDLMDNRYWSDLVHKNLLDR